MTRAKRQRRTATQRPRRQPKSRRRREALTPKQRRFVEEYLVDLNGTQAAIRAGYSVRTAASIAHENLRKPEIATVVAEGQARRQQQLEITRDDIARELTKVGFANMADYVEVDDEGDLHFDFSRLKWSRDLASPIAEVTVDEFMDGRGEDARPVKRVRFKLIDKRTALVDLAKLLGYWKDRLQVGVTLEELVASSQDVCGECFGAGRFVVVEAGRRSSESCAACGGSGRTGAPVPGADVAPPAAPAHVSRPEPAPGLAEAAPEGREGTGALDVLGGETEGAVVRRRPRFPYNTPAGER